MKVYFSCSLTGGRDDQPIYAAIVQGLQAHGHDILTAHLADPDVVAKESSLSASDVYGRDIAWLDDADAVAAEVSTPSHGVGYEVAYAVSEGKRVICLAHENVRVSKMIAGNPRLTFVRYEDAEQAVGQIARFLGRGEDDKYA